MKEITEFSQCAYVLFFVLAVFASCQRDQDTNSTGLSNGIVEVKVDDRFWSPSLSNGGVLRSMMFDKFEGNYNPQVGKYPEEDFKQLGATRNAF